MKTFTYKNPWHKESMLIEYGPSFYSTDVKPLEYRGYQIFERIKGSSDIVKDGICVTQRACTPLKAKLAIDDIEDNPEDYLSIRAKSNLTPKESR